MPLLLLALLALTASANSATPPPHQLLRDYGFPPGLFPESTETTSVSPQGDGYAFVFNLKEPCSVDYGGGAEFYYESEITGVINSGNITQLVGVTLAYRFQVLGIELSYDSLRFHIPVNPVIYLVLLQVKLFESIPTCNAEAVAADFDPSSKLISKLPIITAA